MYAGYAYGFISLITYDALGGETIALPTYDIASAAYSFSTEISYVIASLSEDAVNLAPISSKFLHNFKPEISLVPANAATDNKCAAPFSAILSSRLPDNTAILTDTIDDEHSFDITLIPVLVVLDVIYRF